MDFLLQEDKEYLLKEYDDTNDKLTCTVKGIDCNAFLLYVERVWELIAHHFQIDLCSAEVFLHKIELNCIKISWFVSPDITSKICELGPLSADFFTQHQISLIMINEECVFDEEIHAKLDMSKV